MNTNYSYYIAYIIFMQWYKWLSFIEHSFDLDSQSTVLAELNMHAKI